jgi:hypothetical protein
MWLRGYRDGETLPQGVAEGAETSLKAATLAAWNALVKKHPEWISEYGANAVKRATKEVVRRHYENMDQDNVDGILFHIEGELADLDESQGVAEDGVEENFGGGMRDRPGPKHRSFDLAENKRQR